jgi:hypothetical protein
LSQLPRPEASYATRAVDTEAPPTPMSFLCLPKRAGPSPTSTIIRAFPRHTYVRERKAQVGIRGIAAASSREANEE